MKLSPETSKSAPSLVTRVMATVLDGQDSPARPSVPAAASIASASVLVSAASGLAVRAAAMDAPR